MSKTPRAALLIWISCLLVSSALGAVGTQTDETLEKIQRVGDFPPEDDLLVPFEVDDAMRTWVRDEIGRHGSRHQRLVRLLEELLGEQNMDINYIAGYTGTASEVFEQRTANCLGFTHLFVGLAREMGIEVEYLRVNDVERIERQGEYIVVSGHVSAGYDTGPDYEILDFSETPVEDYRQIEVMNDHSVVALHYANRGAELMLEERWQEAGSWLEKAVAIDPNLPEGWVNLGVHLRHAGRVIEAEEAYRRSIDLAPDFPSAYQNLAALLMRQANRREEAMALLNLATENNTRNPYHFLALGDLARSQGRLEVAGGYYRRAFNLAPKDAEIVAAMGLWADATEKPRRARKLLRRATSIDPDHPKVRQLAARLTGS